MDPSTDSEKQKHDEDVAEPISAAEPAELQARESLNRNNWDRNADYNEFDGTPEPSAAQNDEAAGGNEDAAESKSSTGHLAGHSGGRTLDDRTLDDIPVSNARGSGSRSQPNHKSQGNAGKVVTMNDLKKDESDAGRYIGGEKSGLAVEDKAKSSMGNVQSYGPSQPSYFRSSGHILGGEGIPSLPVPEQRTLHIWSNGFSYNDGPLYSRDNPVYDMIREELLRSATVESTKEDDASAVTVSEELMRILGLKSGEVDSFQLQWHDNEKQRPAPAPPTNGRRLGSPVPGVGSRSIESAIAPTSQTPAAAASAPTGVDESQPIVAIRIQLPNGTRLSARFNTSQTIGDIYGFVQQSSPFVQQLNPDDPPRNWVLATTFPNKEHIDRSAVLGEMDEFKRGGMAVVKWV